MSSSIQPIQSELLVQLASLQSKIQKRLSGPLSLYGIGLTEYLVLRRLSQAPGQSLRRIDLAEQVGLSASGVTRVLNPMEKIGLVKKDHVVRDARVRLVALTSAGEQVLKDADTSFDQVADSLFTPLDRKKQEVFSGILGMLL